MEDYHLPTHPRIILRPGGAPRAADEAIGDLDALIAAIARTRGFAVATRDTAPFRAAGVAVIDPFG